MNRHPALFLLVIVLLSPAGCSSKPPPEPSISRTFERSTGAVNTGAHTVDLALPEGKTATVKVRYPENLMRIMTGDRALQCLIAKGCPWPLVPLKTGLTAQRIPV